MPTAGTSSSGGFTVAGATQRTLKELLAGLLYARQNQTEWYVWVTEGMPKLTVAEYDAIKAKRRARAASK